MPSLPTHRESSNGGQQTSTKCLYNFYLVNEKLDKGRAEPVVVVVVLNVFEVPRSPTSFNALLIHQLLINHISIGFGDGGEGRSVVGSHLSEDGPANAFSNVGMVVGKV